MCTLKLLKLCEIAAPFILDKRGVRIFKGRWAETKQIACAERMTRSERGAHPV